MKIETKYSLGDKVWKISQNKPKVWERCTFCGGSKYQQSAFDDFTKVIGKDGSKKRCPECQGRGGSHKYLELEWGVKESLIIGQVRFEASKDIDNILTEEESYMEDSRGGFIHYVDTLWPSRKEAQSECDRRNKE